MNELVKSHYGRLVRGLYMRSGLLDMDGCTVCSFYLNLKKKKMALGKLAP